MGPEPKESPVDGLVDQLGGFAASLGINRVAGQLYILLFLSENPLSLDEMTLRLRVSKGHVSTNIRALERWHAVRKVVVRRSRKDYYEANRDTLTVIFEQLQYGLRQRLQEVEELLRALRQDTSRQQQLGARLAEIEGLARRARRLVDNVGLIKPLLGKRTRSL